MGNKTAERMKVNIRIIIRLSAWFIASQKDNEKKRDKTNAGSYDHFPLFSQFET